MAGRLVYLGKGSQNEPLGTPMSDKPINSQDPVPTQPGGSGGLLSHMRHARDDLKIMERAIRQEWDIPEVLRPQLVPIASKMFLDKYASAKTRIAAGRLILAANAQNLAAQALRQEKDRPGAPNINMLVNGGVQFDFSKLTNEQLQALIALRQQMEATQDETAAQSAGGLPGINLPSPTSDQAPQQPSEDHHAGNGHAGHP